MEEVEIHSRVKHVSIVEMFTYFDDANYWYLVLELAHHGTLEQYMRQQHKVRLTEEEAGNVLGQVVEGLLYLHQNQIMHRDLSLSNLLVMECKCQQLTPAHLHVKLADFGLATLSRPNEKHMTLCGTPNYISPEVAARTSHGLPADVWGLGCMLYTLLVGRPPFDTNGVTETLARVVAADYQLPDFLSYEAKDLIRRFLQKNVHDRIRLDEVGQHAFMVKRKFSPKFSSTVASVDSGILTISSNASQNQSRPSPFRPGPYSSTPKQQPTTSGYSSYHDQNIQTSDFLTSTPRTPLQKANSLDLIKENVTLYRDTRPASVQGHHRATPTNTSQQEKLDVPPLNTTRLLPNRQKTRDVKLNIHENGEVELEYLKRRLTVRISGDGMNVWVNEAGRQSMYTYHTLPTKHIKRYKNAYGFVRMVKAKTPKVTFFSPHTKFQLMESMEDCEAFFYSGLKITKTVLGGVKAYDSRDNEVPMPAEDWQHFEECHQHCLTLETTLSQMAAQSSCFPVTIGRRPAVHSSSSSPLVTTLEQAFSTPQSSRINTRTNAVVREATIPGIGVIIQYSSGSWEVTYKDSTKITWNPSGEFIYAELGHETRYSPTNHPPMHVQEKLQQVQTAMERLNHTNSAHLRFMR